MKQIVITMVTTEKPFYAEVTEEELKEVKSFLHKMEFKHKTINFRLFEVGE